jgi:hypothetical protein
MISRQEHVSLWSGNNSDLPNVLAFLYEKKNNSRLKREFGFRFNGDQ